MQGRSWRASGRGLWHARCLCKGCGKTNAVSAFHPFQLRWRSPPWLSFVKPKWQKKNLGTVRDTCVTYIQKSTLDSQVTPRGSGLRMLSTSQPPLRPSVLRLMPYPLSQTGQGSLNIFLAEHGQPVFQRRCSMGRDCDQVSQGFAKGAEAVR